MEFVLPKIGWLLLHPGNLLLLLLCVGVVLTWTRARRAGAALLTIVAAIALMLTFVPLGEWAMIPLENRFAAAPAEPPARVDGVIVLGGSVNQFVGRSRGRPAVGGSVERLLAFAELARRYPDAKLVFTGGSGDLFRQHTKEAEAARPVMQMLGVPVERVIFEDQSRNTHENAVLSRALVGSVAGQSWLLVTSASHMPRAVGTFRAAGWTVLPYPVDFSTEGTYRFEPPLSFTGGLGRLQAAAKEWLGLAYYYLVGRTAAFFPEP